MVRYLINTPGGDKMADPRAFIRFDFDHNETEKKPVCRTIQKFKRTDR